MQLLAILQSHKILMISLFVEVQSLLYHPNLESCQIIAVQRRPKRDAVYVECSAESGLQVLFFAGRLLCIGFLHYLIRGGI
jgi:hypothetical protein